MTEGPLDNYLTADEDAYFKNRGTGEAEAVIEETQGNEETDTASVGDTEGGNGESAREEHSDGDDTSAEDDDGYEADAEEEEHENPKKGRDFEKAFKTERHKRKELKEAFEAHAKKTAEMEAMLARMQQTMQQQQAQAQQSRAPEAKEIVPDAEEDPIGYQQYKIQKLEESLNQQSQYLKQQQEYSQRTAQENAFKNAYMNSAQQFSKSAPDFTQAYKYLTDARTKEHIAAGFSSDEAERLLVEEETAIVAKAFKDGVNPAERMYNLAKNRGYTGKATSAPKGKSLTDIKKGMDNAKSLKSGGGELPDRDYGLDDIDGMDFAEFDKFWAGYKSKSKGIG